jgi:hypothetical protein
MNIWGLLFLLINCIIIIFIIFAFKINKILLKYNKKIIPRKYLIILLIVFTFVIYSEYWIHLHDHINGIDVLNKRLAMPYIFASFLPIENIVTYDNIEIRLPYGYKLVEKYSSVGVIYSEKSWNTFYDEMNTKFEYIDRFGSSELWIDNANNKTVSVHHIRRGGIYYLTINIK